MEEQSHSALDGEGAGQWIVNCCFACGCGKEPPDLGVTKTEQEK